MAKEKFDRSKAHVNIGTIGHVGPSSAAATLSVSVWAENVCFCCIQDPLLCQMVNGRRDSAR